MWEQGAAGVNPETQLFLLFQSCDNHARGLLNQFELGTLCQKLHCEAKETDDILSLLFDNNPRGLVDFQTFRKVLVSLLSEAVQARVLLSSGAGACHFLLLKLFSVHTTFGYFLN